MLVLAFVLEFLLEGLSADTTQRQDALSAEEGCGTTSHLPGMWEREFLGTVSASLRLSADPC